MAELLPCPFCGGEAKIVENGFGFVDVSCKKRGCRGYVKFLYYTKKEKAISKWNTRTPKKGVMGMAAFDCKEYARQMRERAVKDHNGNIICSPELWERIASIIESTRTPKERERKE